MTDVDDAITEIEASLKKLRAYADARYNQGVADERKRAIAAIEGGTNTPAPKPETVPAKAAVVLSRPAASTLVRHRIRAPRGLAKSMILRAIPDANSKGMTSEGVAKTARTTLEKMVTVSAIRNEFRVLREAGEFELTDGVWRRIKK